ncbi:exosome complex exonuclease Rrp41 [archaeon]|jgi:exosome complex component RRP41|nr:exosome complex exonuclease Rrp41 [archaeon]MBT6698243.1 exosome complex exonuclease Rrp41 [archaeon]
MAYTKRFDGRKNDELRPMIVKAGVIKKADGSAYFKIGNTECFASVYGPRELHPRFLQNPKKGIIRCHYNMLPFSGTGSRIRPGNKRRSQEISMVMEKALNPVVDLTAYPNTVVDIYIEFPQTDAGTRCAAISAASIALADAGIRMKEMVSSVAMGEVDGTVVADLTYAEEAFDGIVSDIPVAMVNSTQEITLLQMDGEITKKALIESLNAAKAATAKIHVLQEAALKAKYAGAKTSAKVANAQTKPVEGSQ